jgi:hypothetical protein
LYQQSIAEMVLSGMEQTNASLNQSMVELAFTRMELKIDG